MCTPSQNKCQKFTCGQHGTVVLCTNSVLVSLPSGRICIFTSGKSQLALVGRYSIEALPGTSEMGKDSPPRALLGIVSIIMVRDLTNTRHAESLHQIRTSLTRGKRYQACEAWPSSRGAFVFPPKLTTDLIRLITYV